MLDATRKNIIIIGDMKLEKLLAMGNHSSRKEFFVKVFIFIFNIYNSFTTSS